MAEVDIHDIEGIVGELTASADAVIKRGNTVGHDGTNWVQADASTASAPLFAQFVALSDADGNDTRNNKFPACRRCTLYDSDAPYTADTSLYQSATAGAITETRPTTNGDVIQVVGRTLDTYRARLEIKPPTEYEIYVSPDQLDTTGEPGLGTADAGWAGPQLDGAGEEVYFKGRVPCGSIGLPIQARILYNSIGASAFDTDITYVGAYDGASNVEDTGAAITAGDWNADTDNIISYQDISSGLDAAFWLPGRSFCIMSDVDAITGDAQAIALSIRGWTV